MVEGACDSSALKAFFRLQREPNLNRRMPIFIFLFMYDKIVAVQPGMLSKLMFMLVINVKHCGNPSTSVVVQTTSTKNC